jgi:hypothetical protein
MGKENKTKGKRMVKAKLKTKGKIIWGIAGEMKGKAKRKVRITREMWGKMMA